MLCWWHCRAIVTCADLVFLFHETVSFCRLIFFSFRAWKHRIVTKKLTDKLKCILKVLFNVLVRRVVRWYLFVSNARFVLYRWGLTGDVENTVGTDAGRIDGVASIAEQQMRENWRCWMRFNIWNVMRNGLENVLKVCRPLRRRDSIFALLSIRSPVNDAACQRNWKRSQLEIEKDLN